MNNVVAIAPLIITKSILLSIWYLQRSRKIEKHVTPVTVNLCSFQYWLSMWSSKWKYCVSLWDKAFIYRPGLNKDSWILISLQPVALLLCIDYVDTHLSVSPTHMLSRIWGTVELWTRAQVSAEIIWLYLRHPLTCIVCQRLQFTLSSQYCQSTIWLDLTQKGRW